MAAVPPVTILPGFTALASGNPAPADCIAIPLTALPGLSPAEADETTGSAAKVLYEINRAAEKNYNLIPIDNRSTRLMINRGFPAGASEDTINQTFTSTFTLSITDADVADEV